MYSMELRRPPLRGLRAIGVIAAIVAAVFLSTFLANLLALWVPAAAYLSYALVFLLALYAYKRFVVEYRYSLSRGGTFMVERLAGSRARELFKERVGDIEYYGDPEGAPKTAKSRRFLLSDDARTARALVVTERDAQTTLYLQPDERMDELLGRLAAGLPAFEEDDDDGAADADPPAEEGGAETQ